MSKALYCHDCQSEDIHLFPEYAELSRVTSDCKPWKSGGSLQVCRSCGLVQPQVDEKWREECSQIYGEYESNYQSGGVDQAIFDPATGEAGERSEKLLLEMIERNLIGSKGDLIDIGCGSGGFLRGCSRNLPNWRLYGLESAAKYEKEIRAIPGVENFFPVGFQELEGEYSLISLLHVFEHLEAPSKAFKRLGENLTPDGSIFIEVPSFEENPFELVVADHSSHFTAAQLLRMVEAMQSELRHGRDVSWIPKEISLLAGSSKSDERAMLSPEEADEIIALTQRQVAWLVSAAEAASRLCELGKPFGVFGTSIAANWLIGTIGTENIGFFVDEDPGRADRSHFGKPIVSPAHVEEGTTVFVPLAPAVAQSVAERLGGGGYSLVLP